MKCPNRVSQTQVNQLTSSPHTMDLISECLRCVCAGGNQAHLWFQTASGEVKRAVLPAARLPGKWKISWLPWTTTISGYWYTYEEVSKIPSLTLGKTVHNSALPGLVLFREHRECQHN